MIWFYLTILAVIFQTQRNLLQKSLRNKLTTIEVSWARIFYVFPVLLIVLAYLLTVKREFFVNIDSMFYLYCFGCGLAQIMATLCLVELFSSRNFSIGVAYTKTDTIQTAILASVFLGEAVPFLAIFAIIMAFLGVLLLTPIDSERGVLNKVLHKSTLLGLGSGFFLAITTIFMKKATLMASFTLNDKIVAIVIVFSVYVAIQNILYVFYEAYHKRLRETFINMISHRKRVSWISFFSMLGTMCWISAFLLQKVAYVKLVAQIEVLLSLFVAHKLFQEKNSKKEFIGMALLILSVLLILFAK